MRLAGEARLSPHSGKGVEIMKSHLLLVGLIVIVTLIITVGPGLACLALLLAGALYLLILTQFIYQPGDCQLGVIYVSDCLDRLVGPGELAVVIPGWHERRTPISLRLRQVEVRLETVLTANGLPVDCVVLVRYRVDPRRAALDICREIVTFSDERWDSMVESNLREVATIALADYTHQQLLCAQGYQSVRREMGRALAHQMRDVGVIVVLESGVHVQKILPAAKMWKPIMECLNPGNLGDAARSSVTPLLDEIENRRSGVASDALQLAWATASVQRGDQPQVVVDPTAYDGGIRGRPRHPGMPDGPA